jgi:predicted PurR-regulated permease PerM
MKNSMSSGPETRFRPEEPEEPAHRVQLVVPFGTIAKLLVAALFVWVVLELWLLFLVCLVAVLLAVTLHPVVAWLQGRGLSRGLSVAVVGLTVLGLILAFAAFVLPPLVGQTIRLAENFPAYRDSVQQHLPTDQPFLKEIAGEIFDLPSSPGIRKWLEQPLLWGKIAVGVIALTFFLYVLTIYLLLDGKRVYAWLLAYVPRRYRRRIADTVPEVSEVVFAYVGGQFVTSALATAVTFGILVSFGVPGAVPLALLAGIADVIPIIGIVISTVPAVLMALTVSPLAGVGVLLLYILYHVVEAYVLVPRIYGRRLQLSTLAVLLALVIGGTLQGIVGAILILPLVAAYPIIERIWLHDYLSSEVIHDHSALERAAESGSDQAVDAVLKGQRHQDERTAEGVVLPSNRR